MNKQKKQQQESPPERGGALIGKGRGAPIEDPESPPVQSPPTEHGRVPDELERESGQGREDRADRAARDAGPARE